MMKDKLRFETDAIRTDELQTNPNHSSMNKATSTSQLLGLNFVGIGSIIMYIVQYDETYSRSELSTFVTIDLQSSLLRTHNNNLNYIQLPWKVLVIACTQCRYIILIMVAFN